MTLARPRIIATPHTTSQKCTHIIRKIALRRAPRGGILSSMADGVVPDPPLDVSLQMGDTASELRDNFKVSEDLQRLLERGLHGSKLPKPLRTVKSAEAFQQAFEIIGGVPRLAIWADANPDKFFALYARMIPQTIAPVLPDDESGKSNVIELPWVTARRLMYKEAQQIATDIEAKQVSSLPKQSDGS